MEDLQALLPRAAHRLRIDTTPPSISVIDYENELTASPLCIHTTLTSFEKGSDEPSLRLRQFAPRKCPSTTSAISESSISTSSSSLLFEELDFDTDYEVLDSRWTNRRVKMGSPRTPEKLSPWTFTGQTCIPRISVDFRPIDWSSDGPHEAMSRAVSPCNDMFNRHVPTMSNECPIPPPLKTLRWTPQADNFHTSVDRISRIGLSEEPDDDYCFVHSLPRPKSSPNQIENHNEDSDSDQELDDSRTETEEPGTDWHTNKEQDPDFSFSEECSPQQKPIRQTSQRSRQVWNRSCGLNVAATGSQGTTPANIPTSTTTATANNGNPSGPTASSIFKSSSSLKRKRERQEDDDPENNPPKRPQSNDNQEKNQVKFACPFRKHNPRKYNLYQPQYKTCALSSFEALGRLKEHIYRRHRSPVQCVRCWLTFSDQLALDKHLSVEQICSYRPGQRSEGITADMEKKLRSRKRTSPAQSDEERWRDIYRMLFPNDEEIPTPYYEKIQDDVALIEQEFPPLSIEDYLRREVPLIFRSRLEAEVNIHDIGKDDPQSFFDRLAKMVDDSHDAAISAHRLISAAGNNSLGSLAVPARDSYDRNLSTSSVSSFLTTSIGTTTAPSSRRPSEQDSWPSHVNNHYSVPIKRFEMPPTRGDHNAFLNETTSTPFVSFMSNPISSNAEKAPPPFLRPGHKSSPAFLGYNTESYEEFGLDSSAYDFDEMDLHLCV